MHAILEGFIKAKRYASKEILSPVVIHITQSLSDRLLEWEIPLGKKAGQTKLRQLMKKEMKKKKISISPLLFRYLL